MSYLLALDPWLVAIVIALLVLAAKDAIERIFRERP